MHNYLAYSAAGLYLAVILLPFIWQKTGTALGWCAWAIHAGSLVGAVFAGDNLRIGFAGMLSTAFWMVALVYLLENRQAKLGGLKFLVLPPVACASLLPEFFPGAVFSLAGKPAMFPWHIAIALLAYSCLTIAALHALIMRMQDQHLHRLQKVKRRPWLQAALEKLPALLTMEKILFRLIRLGFVLLSLTLLTGVVFSEQVLGVALRWDHKTVFSLLSWVLFAILLIGRHWQGWRGKTVLNFTIMGFSALLLAYVGSRFVLEVILHRG